jgi:hypothetical protein
MFFCRDEIEFVLRLGMIFDGLVRGGKKAAEKNAMYNDNDIAVAH